MFISIRNMFMVTAIVMALTSRQNIRVLDEPMGPPAPETILTETIETETILTEEVICE